MARRLHELPVLAALAGAVTIAFSAIFVALLGVVLISGAVGHGAYGRNPGLGALYGVLTGLAYTGFILVLRAGNVDIRRPAGPLADATMVAALGAALLGLAYGD